MVAQHEGQSESTALILSVLRYMTGDASLAETADRTDVDPHVISQLSSEYAAYMVPRALRALRRARSADDH